MAEGTGKMFAGAGRVAKRVPKWAYYVSAGVLVAAGIYYFRSGGSAQADASGDTYTDEGAVGYTDGDQAPGIIVPPVLGGEAVSGELNTDIPSDTLGIFGGVISDLTGLIQTQHDDQSEILGILAGAGSPQQGASATGGTVTVQPKGAPKPKPNPVAKLEPGYRAGATVDMGPHARKTFPGAIGWVRIGDGGKGAAHFIDVHVRFCNKMERWRVRPNAKGAPWSKTWSGPRPQICK